MKVCASIKVLLSYHVHVPAAVADPASGTMTSVTTPQVNKLGQGSATLNTQRPISHRKENTGSHKTLLTSKMKITLHILFFTFMLCIKKL